MNKIIIFVALLVNCQSLLADNLPTTVNVALEQAFVPIGFDDNDRAQFAVTGTFTNTCFRVGPYALKVNQEQKTITIQQQAYHYKGVCVPVMVPFTQIINVGLLNPSDYKIVDYESKKELGVLNVVRSKNNGPDDFLYAPVTDAYIVNETDATKNTLVLTGFFSDRCSEFQEIEVIYQKNVLVVQPVVKRIVPFSCTPSKTRFLKLVPLREDVHGVHLLHVRSLEGQAINKIVELE